MQQKTLDAYYAYLCIFMQRTFLLILFFPFSFFLFFPRKRRRKQKIKYFFQKGIDKHKNL